MKLDSVVIRNFRSIKFVSIQFAPSCLILAGINESGKSNILKALSSLGDYLPRRDDIREPAPDEAPVTSSEIRFNFSLSTPDYKVVLAEVKKKLLYKRSVPLALHKGTPLDVDGFVSKRSTGLIEVNIVQQTRRATYWSIDPEFEVMTGWMKPSAIGEIGLPVDGVNVSGFELVFQPDYPDIPGDNLEPATIDDVADVVGAVVSEFILAHIPKTLLWQYKESNLLPSSISLDEFVANQDTCIPLKNMFGLAGIKNIPEAITEARSKSRNALDNFFASIAKKTTDHFRAVWKEHKSIEFALRPDGANLIPGVRENNVYDFEKRSDGFKRFVSFLLLVSATVKSGALSNTLLLVDEPEISLHPSGARFLRDELIRISESNLVVYSTHSIFMIDRDRVDRHLIVSKANEETQVSVANDANLFAEEVIYNALGYSVFETMRQKNLIFEGWKDKQLFSLAIKKLPVSHANLRELFKDVGLCHVKGVKQIKSITPLIELANRECVIVSDGDAPAKEKQSEYESDKGYGVWKRYDELLTNSVEQITSEDFIKPSSFRVPLKEVGLRYPELPVFNFDQFDRGKSKIREIDRWLSAGGVEKEKRKIEIALIKETVSKNLKASDIEPIYFDMLSELAKHL